MVKLKKDLGETDKEREEIIIRGWMLESVMLEGEHFGVTTL